MRALAHEKNVYPMVFEGPLHDGAIAILIGFVQWAYIARQRTVNWPTLGVGLRDLTSNSTTTEKKTRTTVERKGAARTSYSMKD